MRVRLGQQTSSAGLPQLVCMEGEGRACVDNIVVGGGAVKASLHLVVALHLISVVLHRVGVDLVAAAGCAQQ